jgi:hypothetical protein
LHVRSIIAPNKIVPGKYPNDFVIVDLKPSENARCVSSTLCNVHLSAGTITQQDIKTTTNAPHNVRTKLIVHLRSLHRPKIKNERPNLHVLLEFLTNTNSTIFWQT